MPTFTELTTTAQEGLIQSIRTGGELTASTVKSWRAATDRFVPELPTIPGLDVLPSVAEVTENVFDFTAKVLEAQHDAAIAVMEAFTADDKPASKAKK